MSEDRWLGLNRPISRRDFVHGASGAAFGALLTGRARGQAADYPPARTGLRGSHEGSFETAHALGREGQTSWGGVTAAESDLDLVVVGGGVSGLAAAWFYRQDQPGARILVLDNHDDFGGHAKRNEFLVDGRTLIGYGGSQSLEAPSAYSEVAKNLLSKLTVDLDRFDRAFDRGFHSRHGLSAGIYFDRATYGSDAFVPASFLFNSAMLELADPGLSAADAINRMPLSAAERAEFLALVENREDRLPDVTLTQLTDQLRSVSYETFLTRNLGVGSERLLTLLRRMPAGYFGVGTDAVPALDAMLFGLPGLNKIGVPGAAWLARTAIGLLAEPYIHHFPDGNASIARALVRSLIPEITPAVQAEALVTARFDYATLDHADHNVRIRLESTVVNARNEKDGVVVSYVNNGRLEQARARHAVLACYNMMIPHLCPELPAAQREALASLVKVPLVYSNVAFRNWQAQHDLGIGFAFTPSAFHDYCMVDFPVSMGGYAFPRSPAEPMLMHFSAALGAPGLPPRDQHRAGRARLLATRFEDIERDLRRTLAGMLGPAGFDPARDIAGITVNRWPHGYAYTYNPLFDPDHAPGLAPHEIGRRRFGNITIANSDAGARAYLDEAIDQGHRAVSELLG